MHQDARPQRPTDASEGPTFTYHRTSMYGAVVFVVVLATGVEVGAAHLLLGLWSPPIAWILTAVGIFGALWMVGDWRACRLRPVEIGGGTVRIHFGLRWRLRIPIDTIERIRPPNPDERQSRSGPDLRLALPGSAWWVMELSRPLQARTVQGRHRAVRSFALGLDDMDGFVEAWTALVPAADRARSEP